MTTPKSKVITGYFVSTDSKSAAQDEKAKPVLNMGSVKKLLTGVGKGKLTKVRTKVAYYVTNTSGAGVSLSTVVPVQPGSSSEYASFAAIFDEVYVHGGVVFHDVQTNVSAAGDNDGVIMYDPEDATALTSVVGGLVAQQCFGPLNLHEGGSAAATHSPEAFTKTGYWQFPFHCPTQTQRNLSNDIVLTGQWASTSNTTAVFGWIKPYWDAVSGATITSDYYVVLDVSFRSRV